MTRRKRLWRRLEDVLVYAVVALIFVAILAGVFGIRLAITGGDVGCAFAADPALCVAVKETGR